MRYDEGFELVVEEMYGGNDGDMEWGISEVQELLSKHNQMMSNFYDEASHWVEHKDEGDELMGMLLGIRNDYESILKRFGEHIKFDRSDELRKF